MLKSFLLANRTAVIIALATTLIIGGGVFLLSKGGIASPSKVDNKLLIESDSEKIGSPSATVTLVEFGDYECPACGAYHPFVKQLLGDLSGKVNFVFRNFPLSQHANAKISSYAAEAAGLQGKFEVMHNKLYESQGDWSNSTDARSIFLGYAKDLGLNVDQFSKDMDSNAVKQKIDRDLADGTTLNINETPTFFLDGVKIGLPGSYDQFKSIVQAEINKNPLPSATSASYHIHFDLKTYINGTAIDFSESKYQESKTNTLDENIHFHDGNGDIVHVHKVGVALSELFSSLKISFPADNSSSDLKVFVNGKQNSQGLSYVPQDTDQILVSFGPANDSNITAQLNSVTNNACIYSLKCPSRGTPPPEDCVGGIGTGCTD